MKQHTENEIERTIINYKTIRAIQPIYKTKYF